VAVGPITLGVKRAGEPGAGNPPARLCVQERLMGSAGGRPAGVRIGSPVAGRAGRRVTKGSEAPRQPHPWDEGKFSGRNESEREVAPKVSSPGGRARNREGEGCTARRRPIDAAGCSGGVVSDGTTTRTHRATGEALLVPPRKRRKLGRPYNRQHREGGRRREGGGWARSSVDAASWPLSQGALLFVVLPSTREAGVLC